VCPFEASCRVAAPKRRSGGREKATEDPKYSENRIFGQSRASSECRRERDFKRLHVKFITPWINGIFQAINELEPP
jgi:hypothetical protein